MQRYNFPRPVYTKDLKDIPEPLRRHEWLRTIDFNKLPKYQLKVRMCCAKCEEKVMEEIREVCGVVDVIAYRADKKVVVTGMPKWPEAGFDSRFESREGFLDTDEVLRKARKIDCKARFVTLDPVVAVKPVPKQCDQKSGDQKSKPNLADPNVRVHSSGCPSSACSTTCRGCPSSGCSTTCRGCPSSGCSTAYTQGPPYAFCRDPAQDDNTPFYFLLFLILLLLLLIFRK